jgi:hypothetical protein
LRRESPTAEDTQSTVRYGFATQTALQPEGVYIKKHKKENPSQYHARHQE